jgi:prepilin-type N-terminal cleavage/methylation domain-containing protein
MKNKLQQWNGDRFGFTLLEFIIVIAIVGALVSILLPAIGGARESARATACRVNVRQLAFAVSNFESSRARFPPGTLGYGYAVPWNEFRNHATSKVYWKRFQHTSFIALILADLELSNLQARLDPVALDLAKPIPSGSYAWFGEIRGFREVGSTRLPAVLCPSDSTDSETFEWAGGSQPVLFHTETTDALSYLQYMSSMFDGKLHATNYLGCGGAHSGGLHSDPGRNRFRGIMSSGSLVANRSVLDGTSNTILLGESIGEYQDGKRLCMQPWIVGGLGRGRGVIPWNVPPLSDENMFGDDYNATMFGFGSKHTMVHFAFGDGGVRGLSRRSDWRVVYALCGMGDGELTDVPIGE